MGALKRPVSVRLRLLALALLPLLVLMPLLLGVAMMRWIDKFDRLLVAKVASDLRVAEQYLDRLKDGQAAAIAATGESRAFATARAQGEGAVRALLAEERAAQGLDFLFRAPAGAATVPAQIRPVAAAAAPDAPRTELAVLPPAALSALAPGLAARARIALVPTPAARPLERQAERRGLVLVSVAVADDGTRLVGGRLLNRDLDFIDTINDLAYPTGAVREAAIGTATLFLDDVRVSTNVRLFEGRRALGTRVSEVVWSAVIGAGETWLDSAFVVNDWYMSAYTPVTDITGERVGMLYVGFLEQPYTNQKAATIIALGAAFLAVVGLSVPVFLRMARGIFSPLERMTATMARVESGALDARIGHVPRNDEIGQVARHLDRLLDQVQDRDAQLRRWGESLNELVDQRTAELREANDKLEATFQQLVMSEKLASVGEITAGVAHEINNPVAVIQGNLEVVRKALGPAAETCRTELDLIDAQAFRINVIVNKLLDFTRAGETADMAARIDVASVVADSLVLVAADLRKTGVTVTERHAPAPPVLMVETELQQVIVNLLINAMQAMPEGGTITLVSGAESSGGKPGVALRVADTGAGIPPDRQARVFDPFFSTKLSEGTGLGLSISQALVARAGGSISFTTVQGRGTEFLVWVPQADTLSGQTV